MRWLQLQIKATKQTADFISDALMELGSEAVTLLDAKDQPILEPGPGETPLWQEVWVSALFPEDTNIDILLIQLKLILNDETLETRIIPLADKNWTREWLIHFKPMQFGQRLWVTPEEYVSTIQDKNAIVVLLDPGLAFGTGTHPTTALCLTWLEKNIQPGQCVIDYGCGSGILAIAALKLGASIVYAIDNDPLALVATRENATRNKISEAQLITFMPAEFAEKPADVLIANILANPLITLASHFTKLVKIKGQIALSGILVDQINDIQTAYTQSFELNTHLLQDEWALIAGLRRN